MKKILLACTAGLSTSMLVQRMQEAALAKGYDVTIEAMPTNRVTDAVMSTADAVLLGPQVRYELARFVERARKRIPVVVIDTQAYGTMNGAQVLDDIWEKMQ